MIRREMHSFFPIVRMQHLDSNIPWNICYASIGSKILRFARTTLDINTFITLCNCFLKTMQKQENKHR